MRAILRALVASSLVILAGFVVFRYSADSLPGPYLKAEPPAAVGTSGTAKAEKVSGLAVRVGLSGTTGDTTAAQALTETNITATIKAKIAVDEFVHTRAIGVSTRNSVVTLTGRVQSTAEHDHAVALARETSGVTEVVDHIVIEPFE